jgi:N-ethylmaleimide reductase
VGGAIGFNKVGIRLNPSAHGLFGITIDQDTIPTFEYVVNRLNDYADLAYAHLVEPMSPVDKAPYAVTDIAKHFRPLYRGCLVTNCGYNAESAHRAIAEGYADAVAFGSAFIANPDLVERIRLGLSWAAPDINTYYTPGPKGYVDFPAL